MLNRLSTEQLDQSLTSGKDITNRDVIYRTNTPKISIERVYRYGRMFVKTCWIRPKALDLIVFGRFVLTPSKNVENEKCSGF